MVFKNLWLVVSTYPSEKWWSESQLGWFFHSQLNDLNGNKKGSKLPTRPKYRPNLGVFPAIRGYPSPLGSLESSGASSTPWPIPLRLNDIKWLNKTMITDVYCKKNTIQYCIYIYTYTHIYIYISHDSWDVSSSTTNLNNVFAKPQLPPEHHSDSVWPHRPWPAHSGSGPSIECTRRRLGRWVSSRSRGSIPGSWKRVISLLAKGDIYIYM